MIALTGPKGTPGCSFIAAELAHSLAKQGLATLIVDADAEHGGLAALLDVRPNQWSDRLAGSAGLGGLDSSALRDSTLQVQEGLWFAALGESEAGPFDGREIAEAARVVHDAVIVDLGHRPGPLQQQLAAVSDWLLWVVVPDRLGLERADRAVGARVLAAASCGFVFNRIHRGCLDGADVALSSSHGIPVMARIKEEARVAGCIAEGRSALERRSMRDSIRSLARSVHPDAAAVNGTWP